MMQELGQSRVLGLVELVLVFNTNGVSVSGSTGRAFTMSAGLFV